jgi:hypothetical protein
VCWDFSSEFWVVFGLPISCGDYNCFVRLSLSLFICGIRCSNMKLYIYTVPHGGGGGGVVLL